MTYSARKPNPQAEYRLQRNERANSSPTLAQKFATLKKLAVSLDYFDAAGTTRTGGMNYKLNVLHAKSILLFNCAYADCVGGDFDLTKEIAQAVSTRQKSVHGELRCGGVRHKIHHKDLSSCQSILRYRLTLGY